MVILIFFIVQEQAQEQAFFKSLNSTLGINTNDISELLEYLLSPESPSCLNDTPYNFSDVFMFFDSSEQMADYTQRNDYRNRSNPSLPCGIVFITFVSKARTLCACYLQQ